MATSVLLALLALGPPMAPPAQASPPQDQGEVVRLEDVEVTARRGSTGIRPEREYDAGQIDAQGAYDIGEVMRRAASSLGPGEEPVVIINGVRVPNASIYFGLPPDALERLEVLPAGSAAAYGGSASGRVLNLVTQRRFSSRDVQLTASTPTQGGSAQGRSNLRHSRLNDRNLSNLTLTWTTASALHARDRPDYRLDHPGSDDVTLGPETDTLSAGAAFSRGLGDWTGSLNLTADTRTSEAVSRNGDVLVVFGTATDNGRIETGLGGKVLDWSVNLTTDVQASETDATGLTPSTTRTRRVGGALRLDRRLPGLSAGPIALNLSASGNRAATQVRAEVAVRSSDVHGAWTALAVIPLTPRRDGAGNRFLHPGAINLTLGAGASQSGSGGGRSFETGLAWELSNTLRLNGSLRRDVSAPTESDRVSPVRVGPAVVVYDFVQEEAVEVLTLFGGNPDLRAGTLEGMSLNVSAGPFTPWQVSVNADLSRSQTRDGITTDLIPTPETAAAYPDRFIRDAAGRLLQIDQRPFNTASSLTDRLSTSLNLLPASGSSDGRRASLSVSLFHTVTLQDKTDVGSGLAPRDRLAGDGGGLSPQSLMFTVTRQHGPWGAEVSARYEAAYRSRRSTGVDGPADLLVGAFRTANLKLSYTFVKTLPGTAGGASRRGAGARLELVLANLTDARPSARIADGRPAPGYGRDDRDPIGRRLQVSLSKRF